jgi:hypothetical protein
MTNVTLHSGDGNFADKGKGTGVNSEKTAWQGASHDPSALRHLHVQDGPRALSPRSHEPWAKLIATVATEDQLQGANTRISLRRFQGQGNLLQLH